MWERFNLGYIKTVREKYRAASGKSLAFAAAVELGMTQLGKATNNRLVIGKDTGNEQGKIFLNFTSLIVF